MPAPGSMMHLLRLTSPSLPVGAFSYSRGLESAVQHGWVKDEETARAWILGVLEHSFAAFDGAVLLRMMIALAAGDIGAFRRLDAWLASGRESRELQLEDRRMGTALLRLLIDLDVTRAKDCSDEQLGYTAAFALAAEHWALPAGEALRGLMWSVVESQVAASIRLVPLGQTAGQRILIAADEVIERAAVHAESLPDDEIGNASIGMAMASAWHETQYSRLFRS
ncbi:urease accessory protein UreF [Corticibacterium sp. UT-5YL-CI-8]|nr:urease accessory protein UreF [Tianweitania sp. UT-5YL-CI-8]